MRIFNIASGLSGLALLAGGAGGCIDFPFGECPARSASLAPGDTAPNGVDPRLALAALRPQTAPLHWTQIDETTTITITTGLTDMPSVVFDSCDSPQPSSFRISALIGLDTADDRLHATATASNIEVTAAGALVVPRDVAAGFPASLLVGSGVVSDALLAPVAGASAVGISFEMVADGAGVAYGQGTLTLSGPDSIRLAELNPTP